jgi:ribosome-binding protein aMBF1 (putative translation factor)
LSIEEEIMVDGFDIVRARRQKGVTQEELREKLDLTARVTLADIENGKVEVTPAYIYGAIAKVDEIVKERGESQCQSETTPAKQAS